MIHSLKTNSVLAAILAACFLQVSLVMASNPSDAATTLQNSALLFIKPHANTQSVQDLVVDKLNDANIKILSQVDIGGQEIDAKGLIDQHYYSIASKATILAAQDIPVPPEKFQEAFGEEWSDVVKEDRAVNAMEACKRFGCTPAQLNEAWQKVDAVKFGGGFYCAKMTVGRNKPQLYVFNAFFMAMRDKFVGDDKEIRCYVVEWDPKELSWAAFRQSILGPTDPKDAPKQSIRRTILEQYQNLGLKEEPNKSDNGVHASASPFEGLAEKMNWLNMDPQYDNFGKALLDAGLTKEQIGEWAKDPQVKLSSEGKAGSIFDELEEMDADDCLKKLVSLNELNRRPSEAEL